MLYHFLYPLAHEVNAFNVFRYITFRSVVGFLAATILSIWLGRFFIRYMKGKQFGQVIRHDGPKEHFKKGGTPTMGGIFIVGSIILTLFLVGNFASPPLLGVLGVMASYFVLGFLDDYLKVMKNNSKGISVKGKLLWQFITALGVGYYLLETGVVDSKIYLPFLKGPFWDMGYFYLLFVALVIVGSSNAVNLTDGLDGLAIVPIITCGATLGLFSYVAGHHSIANYLYIPYIETVGELTVLASAMVGAGVGFLWYNSYPAQVFMGDVGSLSLGGGLGAMAVVSKNELLFTVIGGIFVVEAVSVILQVTFYKLKKKRIFKMSPLHHHFELLGWPEPKVIVRFWIVSLFLALLSIATLKTR